MSKGMQQGWRERERAAWRGNLWVWMLGMAASLAGCGPATQTLRVEVRDVVSKEPAAGVTVFADVPSRDHPFSIATLLKQTGPLSWREKTNERGVAELKYVAGRPVRVGVLSAGWAVGVVMVEPDAAGFEANAWLTSNESESAAAHTPEYRVVR